MYRILLAQEPSTLIDAQIDTLSRLDVKVFTASTAEYALELHRAERMDLIIADLDLQVMGGDAMCKIIRDDESLSKVYVALICAGTKTDLQRCGRCGADSFIKAPVSAAEVYDRVMKLIESPARRAMRVLLKITVKGRFRTEEFFCTSRNISASGILIETDQILARGDEITCSFFLPDTERIVLDGVIARITKGTEHKHEYGVRFYPAEPDQLRAIESFVGRERQRGNIY